MMSCWEWHAYNRPTFDQLREKLQDSASSENDCFYPTIEINDEIDQTAYDRDIGKTDSNDFSPGDTSHPEGSSSLESEGLSNNSRTNLNETIQDNFTENPNEIHDLRELSYGGDVPVTLDSPTGSNEELV